MSDQNRPASRWSTSMSITTKSTAATNQTTPLINIRRKLLRQFTNSQKNLSQRMTKSKHDIEELFKLYYSNDIKFDTFQGQIVTGTRIPTAQVSPTPQKHLTASSTNAFHSKHCTSREQISTLDMDYNEATKRSVQIRIDTHSPTIHPSPSLSTATPGIQDLSSSVQHDELCESPLVKSTTFLEDIASESNENMNIKKISQRPIFTVTPGPPPPSLLVMNNNYNRKDPTNLSHTSFSTLHSLQQQQHQLNIVTGSAVSVQHRLPTKQSWNKQRAKSNTTMTRNSSTQPSTTKNGSPSLFNPLSIYPDISESPVFIGSQRVVSIPSKCSRYVLVTFPEVPLRYNAPSYVERLLLPERFPTLFQNIVQSYDHHLTSDQHNHITQ